MTWTCSTAPAGADLPMACLSRVTISLLTGSRDRRLPGAPPAPAANRRGRASGSRMSRPCEWDTLDRPGSGRGGTEGPDSGLLALIPPYVSGRHCLHARRSGAGTNSAVRLGHARSLAVAPTAPSARASVGPAHSGDLGRNPRRSPDSAPSSRASRNALLGDPHPAAVQPYLELTRMTWTYPAAPTGGDLPTAYLTRFTMGPSLRGGTI
jgi:hypothetical protein